MNRIAAFLVLVSFGLGIAGFRSFPSKRWPDVTIVVDPRSCDFGTLAVKERASVFVLFRNESDSTARILGSVGYCTKRGCLTARGLPIEIQPGREARVEVRVVGYQPGPFAQELSFHTGSAYDAPFTVKVVGEVRPERSSAGL